MIRIGGKPLNLATLTNVEAMAVEDVTGLTVGEVEQLANKGSARALTAFLWVLRRRDEPDLQFGDVVFSFDDLQVVDEDAEQPANPTDAGSPAS